MNSGSIGNARRVEKDSFRQDSREVQGAEGAPIQRTGRSRSCFNRPVYSKPLIQHDLFRRASILCRFRTPQPAAIQTGVTTSSFHPTPVPKVNCGIACADVL